MKSRLQQILGLLIIVCCGLILRLIFSAEYSVKTDSTYYFELADRITHGFWYLDSPLVIHRWLQPGLSAVIAGLQPVFQDTVQIGRWIALISGLAVLPLAYYIGRVLFNRSVGLLATVLCAIHPPLIKYSSIVYTESLFTVLVMMTVAWFLWAKNKKAWWPDILLAALIAATYYVRMVGLGALAVVVLWRLAEGFRHRLPWRLVIRHVAVVVVTTMVLVGPYMLIVSRDVGVLSFGDQPTWSSIFRSYNPEDLSNRAGIHRVLYSLNQDQTDYSINTLDKTATGYSIQTALQYTRHYLPMNAWIFTLWFGAIGLFCVLPWMLIRIRQRRSTEPAWFLLSWIPPLISLYYLKETIYRYQEPLDPLLMLLAAAAIVLVWRSITFPPIRWITIMAMAVAILYLPWITTFGYHWLPQSRVWWRVDPSAQTGQEIRSRIGPGQSIFSTLPVYAYFAGAKNYPLPTDEYEKILTYARKERVRYLLLDYSWNHTNRPLLKDFYDQTPLSAQLVYRYDDIYLYRLAID